MQSGEVVEGHRERKLRLEPRGITRLLSAGLYSNHPVALPSNFGRSKKRRTRPHLRHPLRPEREASGDDSWQALGDGRNGKRDRDLEVVRALLEVELNVGGERGSRVEGEEVLVVDHPHEHAHGADDLGKEIRKVVQLSADGRDRQVLIRREITR